MKKLALIIALTALSISMFAQNTWRWGLTLGSADNSSRFSGGMTEAAAVFNHTTYPGGYIGIKFRKTYCPHFSLEAAFKVVTLGFQYEIAQDYSLVSHGPGGTVNKIPIGVINIPVTGIYNSNFNCSNWRWYAGLGLSLSMGGQQKDIVSTTNPPDQVSGNTNVSSYISQDVHNAPVISPEGHFICGIEKEMRCGRMLSFGLIFNRGFTPIATSNVTYTANNINYQHSFTNYGSYSGLALSYYFRSHGGVKSIEKVVK